MEKSPVPHPPVMHSLVSASTIAWLIHQKFGLGIPLSRKEKELDGLSPEQKKKERLVRERPLL